MLWFHSSRCQFSPCTRRCRQRAAEARLCLLIWKGVEISLKTKSKLLRSISGSRFLDNIRFNFAWIWDLTNNQLINLVTKNASSLDSADATTVISSLCLGTIHKQGLHFFQILETLLPHVGSLLVLSVANFVQFWPLLIANVIYGWPLT